MDWGTLIGTGVGGVVALAATMIAERARWRRDESVRRLETKRQLYADYLTALTRTRNHLKDIVQSPALAPEERVRQSAEAYREGGAYELRHQMGILASKPVVTAADEAFRRLRDIRDLVRDGKEGALKEEFDAMIHAIRTLRDAMRTDLGTDA
ncbi:hypothetical protein [Streptomyces radicis]|uniref:Uncharacterized protein n=1 Tax=Streptomyces radicis TaxID=1750517 RepID=A0A3A9WLF4_9ACTN|nr:hypothetical protein [Streptomyces radicis]RKN08576.1 hypothetical protein D7319_14345 [Streptomyces radicis]RKN21734.1 hypothetical protein D7318_15300 [Streptomyces radicis]